MSAVAVAGAPGVRPLLEHYRDDGPLGRLLGRALGRRSVPAELFVVAAVLLLAGLLIADGADVSKAELGAAIAFAVIAGGISSGCSHGGRFAWAVPTLLRLLEYGTLIWIVRTHSTESLPGVFALLCAIAFRHYDIVYRLRHQRVPPPDWINWIGTGWEGRLLIVFGLWLIGALPWALYVLAFLLALVSVWESAAGWVSMSTRGMEEDDDEDETP